MKSSGLNIMLRDDFFPFGFLLGLSSPILRFLFCFEFVLVYGALLLGFCIASYCFAGIEVQGL